MFLFFVYRKDSANRLRRHTQTFRSENAENSLYAEVQPVLAISIAKLRREFEENKKTAAILMKFVWTIS